MKLNALIRRYFETVVAPHYAGILAVSLILAVLAGWTIVAKWNINSDFKALLPQSSPAAMAMTEVSDRIGSGSALFVVIDSPDREANRKFAKVYSEAMLSEDGVALAHFHNDKTFFEKRQLLYLSVDELETLRKRLKKKIKDEKKRANPLFVDLKPKKKQDDGSFIKTDDLASNYKGSAQSQYKEYLESDDGYSLTLIVRFVESSTNLIATNQLMDKVRSIGAELNPTSYHPEMKIEFGGGLVNRQKEYDSILNDVKASALFTIIGLFLVIGLYFRRLRAVALVLGPLIMGILWTLALAFLIYGELTTVTAFIFAILLGLGIDFSIHLLSSYDERRIEGLEPVEALIACYTGTGTATIYGALTTFATFVVLGFAQFRGLSQFGVVASIGVLCSLTAMFTALPAGILAFQKISHSAPRKKSDALESFAQKLFSGKTVALFAVVSIGITAVAVSHFEDITFEENFRKIGKVGWPWAAPLETDEARNARGLGKRIARNVFRSSREAREAMAPDSFVMDREQKSIGAKYSSAVGDAQTSTPTIMLFDDPETTNQIFTVMRDKMNAGELGTIKSATSIHGFMPGTMEQQTARKAEIENIRGVLDKEGTAFLSDKQKERVAELREKLDVEPFTVYDMPTWTKRLFKEAGAAAKPPHEGEAFAFEYTIFLNENVDQMIGNEARRFLTEVVDLSESTQTNLRIGSQSFIYVAMLDEIKTDGVKMMGFALIVVFLLLTLAFRSPFRAFVAFLPLSVGAVWTFGFCAYLGIRFDFFNVIILPVVIGIGIDDGVHFYHRYLEIEEGALPRAWREVGSAVFMTSITSAIGFGGLAITNHFGLRSIGFVAITGIASTLVATLLVLPIVLWLAEHFKISHVTDAKLHSPTE